jgi:rare lipoprotein A
MYRFFFKNILYTVTLYFLFPGFSKSQENTLPKFYFSQIGEASYYGNEFNNRKTSSGELYKKDEYTAAHPFLAFGTSLKVTNLENNRVTVVRINDRGPHRKGRIVDLSFAAAKELGLTKTGTAQVKIETLSEPDENKIKEVILYNGNILRGEEYYVSYKSAVDSVKIGKILSANGRLKICLYKYQNRDKELSVPQVSMDNKEDIKGEFKSTSEKMYSVQVGAFINYENAEDLRQSLIKKKYRDVEMSSLRGNENILYKVTAGNFKSREGATILKNKLLKDNILGFTITKGN